MLQKIEKIIWENVFEQKKKKPGLKFNPEFALISFQTNGPWSWSTSTSTSTLFIKNGFYNRLACKIAIANPGSQVKRRK